MISNHDNVVKCPKCHEGHAHPVAVGVVAATDRYVITRKGLEKDSVYFNNAEGVIIYREYLGECGHRWREVEEFIDGTTFTETMILPFQIGPMDTIWRD